MPKSRKEFVVNEYVVLLYRFSLMLLLYAICRVAFYLFNTSLFPNVNTERFFIILLGGMKFDVSGLLYLNSLFILLSLIPHPWKFKQGFQKILNGIFIGVNAVGLAFNSIDFIYYRFILKRTTASVFAILQNEENMGKLWLQFLADFWYVALFWVAIVWIMIKLYQIVKPIPFKLESRRWLYYPISLVFIALFAVVTIIGMRGGYRHSTRPITLSNAGEFVESPEEMAIVLNTPFCIIRTLDKKSFTHMDFFKSEKELMSVYNPEKYYNTTDGFKKKNVVVFILESFNREFVGALNAHLDNGTYKGYTPFLDSLITKSLAFPNAFANGRKSIDAMPSVIASIPSLVLPYVVSEYSSNKINSMASILGDEGYETAFFHGAPNGSMGFLAFSKLAGFQKYIGKTEYNNDADFDGMWGIWDEPFFQFYGQEISKLKEPFYTTLFSISSHHPFKVPEAYDGVFPKGTLPVHQCVGYSDNALKEFFAYASKQVWYQNTLFVITADHSTVAHFQEYKNNKNAFAIPMLFYTPDGSLKGKDLSVAQQLDIMPTVLAHLGYNKPFVAFGNNLLDTMSNRFAMNYINGNYQLITDSALVHFDGKKMVGSYDLLNDPYLKHNELKVKPNTKIVQSVKAIIQQYNNRMIEDRLVIKDVERFVTKHDKSPKVMSNKALLSK